MDIEVFENNKILHKGFELPARLTTERYLKIYEKIFATLRFDLHEKLEEHVKKAELSDITKIAPQDFDVCWSEVWSKFEQVRVTIFNMMLTSEKENFTANYTQPEAKKIMQ